MNSIGLNSRSSLNPLIPFALLTATTCYQIKKHRESIAEIALSKNYSSAWFGCDGKAESHFFYVEGNRGGKRLYSIHHVHSGFATLSLIQLVASVILGYALKKPYFLLLSSYHLYAFFQARAWMHKPYQRTGKERVHMDECKLPEDFTKYSRSWLRRQLLNLQVEVYAPFFSNFKEEIQTHPLLSAQTKLRKEMFQVWRNLKYPTPGDLPQRWLLDYVQNGEGMGLEYSERMTLEQYLAYIFEKVVYKAFPKSFVFNALVC